jgi:uncharacterized protein YjbI with pentapeptide repeats
MESTTRSWRGDPGAQLGRSQEAELSEADLRDVDLSCTKLTKAYLHDADLSGARLVYTNLNIAELFGDGNRGTETGTRLETELDRPFW